MKHSTRCRSRYRYSSYEGNSLRFERGGITGVVPLPMIDLTKLAGVICAVCNHILTVHIGYERLGLSDIVLLPSGQSESQRVAEAVDTDMDLCSEPTSATTEGLRYLTPLFLGAPAAEWWARTTVLSMIRYSMSGSSMKC